MMQQKTRLRNHPNNSFKPLNSCLI
jgi:hypothetical protein